jgi:hypothetical protein
MRPEVLQFVESGRRHSVDVHSPALSTQRIFSSLMLVKASSELKLDFGLSGEKLGGTGGRRSGPPTFSTNGAANVRPVVFSYQPSAKYLSEIAVRASFDLLWCSLYIASISRMKIDVLLRRSS